MKAAAPPQWKFSQAFGERNPGEVIEDVDIISAIEFESRGEYLATGDRGGRIVLFKRSEGIDMFNIEEEARAKCRKVYMRAHDYNINSISTNSDGESFISADDLRINLWNLEISNQCFNFIDMKPSNMDDLIEVITAAEFHPTRCNLLAYGSSRGFIRLFDMRQSAICDQNARMLKARESHGSRSFFTEIVASISDLKFAKDGRHILSRDYMNLKLWDMHMEGAPVETFKVHEFLRPKLSELYNNDSIFDKFDCCLSSDGHQFASGSYSNTFRIFSCDDGHEVGLVLDVSKNAHRSYNSTNPTSVRRLPGFLRGQRGNNNSGYDISNIISCDFTSKVIHMAWHPTANVIACASANSLYIYCS